MSATMENAVLVERRGAVGWITLNRPAKRNALSLEMWQAVGRAARDFGADPEIRAVVLYGAGGSFAAGADIGQFEDARASAEAEQRYKATADEAFDGLGALPQPLIAMIEGFCIGGGLGLALQADLRVAAEDARFGIPAARLGIAYDHLRLRRLVDIVGPAAAKDILFTARRLEAGEAFRLGLVDRLVPAGGLPAAVEELLVTLCDNAPLSLRACKAAVDDWCLDPADRQPGRLDALERACFDSDDYAEGRRAFMEKRRPRFSGR
ncbi:enoyl-CoA hydratase [Teichococcus aerofrigidensis]